MQSKVLLACLALLLTSALWGQSNSSSQAQPPAANAQVQSDSQISSDAQKDSEKDQDKDKKDDSDRDHKTHVRLGTVSVSAGYIHSPYFFSPFWSYGFGYYPYSFAYTPFFYDPLYGPFYGPWPYAGGFAYGPDKGEVKLSANPKDAQVFVDGAYAGTANHLKDIWLNSGAYDLSVSAPGREPFQKRIYILSGKSLKIDAKLGPQKDKTPTEEKP